MVEPDPFRMHRVALRAASPSLAAGDLHMVLQEIDESGTLAFADFLIDRGVASFWHQIVLTHHTADAAPDLMAALKLERMSDVMLYMAQKAALREVDALLEANNIVYAVMKGAHVREQVYADPALRSAGDIDILVSLAQREAAVRALLQAGFTLNANPENISHEATLIRGGVAIDLHWDILRPGRTRIGVADQLLNRRQRADGYWGLSDTDTVFLMLVHPAFAKYVCSPNMGLNRVVDFILWMHKRPVDWGVVAGMLEKTGLKTAAWAVLQWITMLLTPTSQPVPDSFIASISPGKLRSRYLMYWVRHNLPTRWQHKPLLIQLGFTLLLHDRPADAGHAIAGWLRAKRTKDADPLLRLHS